MDEKEITKVEDLSVEALDELSNGKGEDEDSQEG